MARSSGRTSSSCTDMPALQFRRVFVPSILDGRKTQTIRATLGGGFAPGRALRLQNGYTKTSHVGDAVIADVVEKHIDDLTQQDVELDGFASLEALRVELEATYPGRATMWLVRWRNFSPAR